MTDFRGTDQADLLVGGADGDSFQRLGRGNDRVEGGGEWDFISYRDDGGTLGIKATLGPDGNGTVIDTFGDTDTIVSVQGFEGSSKSDQIIILAGGDYNIQLGRGSDTIEIANGARVTLDYAYYLDDNVVDFVRELKLDIQGIEIDFSTGKATSYNGEVDTFTVQDNLQVRGTKINDVIRGADDGLRSVMDGRGGSDLLIAGDRFDTASFYREAEDIGKGFTVDLVKGLATNAVNSDVDTLVNFSRVEGSDFDDTIIGDAKANYMITLRGNDQVDGGANVDTVAIWTGRDGVSITGIGTDTVTVDGQADGWGIKTLKNVERIDFDNGLLAIDIEGNAGPAYRLYQSTFARTPDQGGLHYWIDDLDAGRSNLVSMANSFFASDEFRGLYGDPETVSNAQFIDLVYANVLKRAPDAEGRGYWLNELDHGQERAVVMASFSESMENHANVAPAINDGIWFAYN